MHLLFVANFPADTGYAWDTIEAVFRRVGEQLVRDGHRLTICYAAMPSGPPQSMAGAPFDFIAFDYERISTRDGRAEFVQLLRDREVDALYLTDRPTWSFNYIAYRRAGIRRIIQHDRTSGERTRRSSIALLLKKSLHSSRWTSADCYIGVSAYVRDRLIHINGTPPDRTWLVYNGIDVTRFDHPEPGAVQRAIRVAETAPVVFCSGRAQPYKGIQDVIEAAARLKAVGVIPEFVYCGDGPYLEELRQQASANGLTNFHFLGRRRDVPKLLGSSTISVVPSRWAEAFGLTVVEAMVAQVPLIAARTGGIPELVEDGKTGILVNPGAVDQLTNALARLLEAPASASEMAARANHIARDRFSLERAAENLYKLVAAQLSE
jgi:glycosyltransferase involved in cell wall biosynthesis